MTRRAAGPMSVACGPLSKPMHPCRLPHGPAPTPRPRKTQTDSGARCHRPSRAETRPMRQRSFHGIWSTGFRSTRCGAHPHQCPRPPPKATATRQKVPPSFAGLIPRAESQKGFRSGENLNGPALTPKRVLEPRRSSGEEHVGLERSGRAKASVARMLRSCRTRSWPITGASWRRLTSTISGEDRRFKHLQSDPTPRYPRARADYSGRGRSLTDTRGNTESPFEQGFQGNL